MTERTKAEVAEAFLADLLRDGPREAAQILAAAEGAGIAGRTIQRAATALCVVKSRAKFRGGWVWRLPEDVEAAKVPSPAEESGPVIAANKPNIPQHSERAEIIAARLRKLEATRGMRAPIHAGDHRLMRWVEAGISDPDLREAYERAATDIRSGGPVTVGYLDSFIAQVMGEGATA